MNELCSGRFSNTPVTTTSNVVFITQGFAHRVCRRFEKSIAIFREMAMPFICDRAPEALPSISGKLNILKKSLPARGTLQFYNFITHPESFRMTPGNS